jgi:hypothetical protein
MTTKGNREFISEQIKSMVKATLEAAEIFQEDLTSILT